MKVDQHAGNSRVAFKEKSCGLEVHTDDPGSGRARNSRPAVQSPKELDEACRADSQIAALELSLCRQLR